MLRMLFSIITLLSLALWETHCGRYGNCVKCTNGGVSKAIYIETVVLKNTNKADITDAINYSCDAHADTGD